MGISDEGEARTSAAILGGFREARLSGIPPVQKDMGVALFVVQLGGTPPSSKPWKGLGPGIHELVEDHRGDTYRAVYTVRIEDSVYLLHAFQKKSKKGIKTPKPDVELVRRRLSTVLKRRLEEEEGQG